MCVCVCVCVCVCAGSGGDKSPTAEDFTDISELAEEGEEASRDLPTRAEQGGAVGGVPAEEDGATEVLFQKGLAFAQAHLLGVCLVCM